MCFQEKFADGRQVISFPDGTRKTISPEGEEKISFPDNTLVIVDKFGNRVVNMPGDRKHVRKSLKTTLERRIESKSSFKLPVTRSQRDVAVL